MAIPPSAPQHPPSCLCEGREAPCGNLPVKVTTPPIPVFAGAQPPRRGTISPLYPVIAKGAKRPVAISLSKSQHPPSCLCKGREAPCGNLPVKVTTPPIPVFASAQHGDPSASPTTPSFLSLRRARSALWQSPRQPHNTLLPVIAKRAKRPVAISPSAPQHLKIIMSLQSARSLPEGGQSPSHRLKIDLKEKLINKGGDRHGFLRKPRDDRYAIY